MSDSQSQEINLGRPLTGCAVGVSISASQDSEQWGFPAERVNRIVLRVASALLGQGAGVVFGHDWRPDGVMEAIHGFAMQMQPPVLPSGTNRVTHPLMVNLLPWPDEPALSEIEQEQLAATLLVQAAGLPDELRAKVSEAIKEGRDHPSFQYLRARGLTHLRRELNGRVGARICLGGKTGGVQGRYPGVIEEALFAIESCKPLYVSGLMGGASLQIIQALKGEEMLRDFCLPITVHEIYRDHSSWEKSDMAERDRRINPREVWETFRKFGLHGLSEANRMNGDEIQDLLHTQDLDCFIGLTLASLAKI